MTWPTVQYPQTIFSYQFLFFFMGSSFCRHYDMSDFLWGPKTDTIIRGVKSVHIEYPSNFRGDTVFSEASKMNISEGSFGYIIAGYVVDDTFGRGRESIPDSYRMFPRKPITARRSTRGIARHHPSRRTVQFHAFPLRGVDIDTTLGILWIMYLQCGYRGCTVYQDSGTAPGFPVQTVSDNYRASSAQASLYTLYARPGFGTWSRQPISYTS